MIIIILFILTISFKYHSCFALNDDWCPDAVCNDITRNCQPCKRKFLFIVAQGRSGSTTVKNMINLLPGVRLSGEMGDIIPTLGGLYSYIDKDKNFKYGNGDMNGPWGHNPYNSDLSCAAQKFVEALNPPEDENDTSDIILGFKEIRVNTVDCLKFLYTHFPCSRFIFNIRSDIDALRKSQEMHFKSFSSINNHSIPRLYSLLYDTLGHRRVYLMDMIQWADVETGSKYFDDLAVWLGFENCKFPKVLRDAVVKGRKWTSDQNRFQLDSSCRYVG